MSATKVRVDTRLSIAKIAGHQFKRPGAAMADEDDASKATVRLVVDNPDIAVSRNRQERDQDEAQDEVDDAIKILAANLMRVTRGAGAPNDILQQCRDVVSAYEEFVSLVGLWPPSWKVAAALDVDPISSQEMSGAELERAIGFDLVIRGALQMTASRLRNQRPQIVAGEKQAIDGIRTIQRYWEERSRAYDQKFKPKGKPKRKPKL